MLANGHGGHLRWEVARGHGVDADVLRPPLGGQGAGHVDHRALGGVVGDRAQLVGMVAHQPLDRGDIDHRALALLQERLARHRLGQQEKARDVQVDDLVPALQRIVLGRRAPNGASIVDQDVDAAEPLQDPLGQGRGGVRSAEIGGEALGLDALGGQLGDGGVQFSRLAGDQGQGRAVLAQGAGDLQAQAPRAAGHDRHAAGQVEEAAQGLSHFARSGAGFWQIALKPAAMKVAM